MKGDYEHGCREVLTLRRGRFKWARIRSSQDHERFSLCAFMDGKFIRVEDAVIAAGTFLPMDSGAQQSIIDLAQQKAAHPNIVDAIKARMQWPDVIPGYLMFEALGFPPFHKECTCRLQGVEVAVGDPLPLCETTAGSPRKSLPRKL